MSLQTLFEMYRRGQVVQPTLTSVQDDDLVDFLAEMEHKDLTAIDAIREKANELRKKHEEAKRAAEVNLL